MRSLASGYLPSYLAKPLRLDSLNCPVYARVALSMGLPHHQLPWRPRAHHLQFGLRIPLTLFFGSPSLTSI